MATYTVTGHPLNYADLGIANVDVLKALLTLTGVGQSVTYTLSGGDDTKAKGHGALK